jgi:hypothetical protein
MEARWICDRAALRCLLCQHPDWSTTQLAQAIGRSLSFVKKWRKRFRAAAADDVTLLRSRSRARHTPFPSPHPEVVVRILAIREQPPENLQRVPGPRTILYYLHRDPHLQASSHCSAAFEPHGVEDLTQSGLYPASSRTQATAASSTRASGRNTGGFQRHFHRAR